MPTAPKHVNWSAATEEDSWVYAFRVITPGGHEFTERRAETIAQWKGKRRDDKEVVQAAYAALKDHIERRVEELDGPATEGRLKFGKKGEVEGIDDAPADVETVESLRAERDDLRARYDALVGTLLQAVAEQAPVEAVADGE